MPMMPMNLPMKIFVRRHRKSKVFRGLQGFADDADEFFI
ncbi:MAG: hypothetical protein CH6_0233 [Candidatus Kapaibacterium sp.]|nr:MAG: hypothetical protein CH6_0233 [Candidatus Kapabacteria bacterium]